MIIISQDGLGLVPMERYAIHAVMDCCRDGAGGCAVRCRIVASDAGREILDLGTYEDEREARATLDAVRKNHNLNAGWHQMPPYGWTRTAAQLE